jgi:hypothetical protein
MGRTSSPHLSTTFKIEMLFNDVAVASQKSNQKPPDDVRVPATCFLSLRALDLRNTTFYLELEGTGTEHKSLRRQGVVESNELGRARWKLGDECGTIRTRELKLENRRFVKVDVVGVAVVVLIAAAAAASLPYPLNLH